MAQPIPDDNCPLDDYLKDTELDIMPGGLAEFFQTYESTYDYSQWVPTSIRTFIHSLETTLSAPNRLSNRQFAERFRYIIISSSLLSTVLSTSPRSSFSASGSTSFIQTDDDETAGSPVTLIALWLLAFTSLAFASGHFFAACAALLFLKYSSISVSSLDVDKTLQTGTTLQTLHHLVESSSSWESLVGEAMDVLRRDETSSMNWQTPLRVALQSSMQAVAHQMDRVRQLFSPLTSPEELAQMCEMYAPPSPSNTHLSLPHQEHPSSPSSRKRDSLTLNKRKTWSGPTPKRQRKRSIDSRGSSPQDEPIPPVPPMPNGFTFDDLNAPFGALALDLQRNRTTPQRYSLISSRSMHQSRTSPTSASRFTTIQASRNPLSINGLNSGLQTALASKRFACAHLLALRFEDEEDGLYWENVRSVVGLLSTSLDDEAARLSEALEEWHLSRQRDARPSVTSSPPTPITQTLARRKPHSKDLPSFAPASSSMEKVTAHMSAVAGALDDAYRELDSCLSALRKINSKTNEGDEAQTPEALEASTKSAFQAYEAIRRELGIAIRECERVRGPLMDIVKENSTEESSLEQEGSTSESSRQMTEPSLPERDTFLPDSPIAPGSSSPPPAYVSRGCSQIVDDATAHLLADATATNLPPPGIDRVFEAYSGPAVKPYKKERSTLSRGERIALVHAKRQSMQAQFQNAHDTMTAEMGLTGLTGPGRRPGSAGQPINVNPERDVVQELKQVINRVSQRKQQLAMKSASMMSNQTRHEQSPPPLPPLSPTSPLSAPLLGQQSSMLESE